MSSVKPSPAATAVLRVNAAFYRAFTQGDFPAMSALWARSAPVTCFHPGSALLRGREAVLDAWRQIIGEPAPFEMRCDQAEAQLFGTTAVVTCYEGNDREPAHLAATNVFVLEDGEWRMVHHQAGPLAQPIRPVSNLN
ncbi:MAG: nuclear transport factor 2 family protein [Polyangiales bacterium]